MSCVVSFLKGSPYRMYCGGNCFIDWYSFLQNVHWCFDALYWKLRWKCHQQLGSKVTTLDRMMRAKKRTTKSGTWCLPSITTPLIITPYHLWQCSKKYLVKIIKYNLHIDFISWYITYLFGGPCETCVWFWSISLQLNCICLI